MRQLKVYMNDVYAGLLTESAPGSGYGFRYDDEYLASAQPPISVTMPKAKRSVESNTLFTVFTNLLPEGANRRAVCRAKKIDESDLFGLLTAMAGCDTIGALNVRRVDNE